MGKKNSFTTFTTNITTNTPNQKDQMLYKQRSTIRAKQY